MKKLASILVVLCFGVTTAAQVFNNAYNNYRHVYEYPNPNYFLYNYDGFGDILLSDSFLISYGYSIIPESFWDTTNLTYFYSVKTKLDGDTLKTEQAIINSSEESIFGTPLILNEKLYLFGFVNNVVNNRYKETPVILSANTNLDILDTITLLINYSSRIVSAQIYSDSSLFLILSTDIDTSTNYNFQYHVIEIDTNYHILRNSIWGGSEIDLLNAVSVKPNGNIVLSSITDSYGFYEEDIHLMEMDINGNIVWENTFGHPGRDILAWRGCIIDSSGNIYISGWTELSSGDMAAWLIKTDSLGNLIWEKKYNRGIYFDGFVGISFSSDGNILLSGSTHNYKFSSHLPIGWLLKVDPNGNIIWERFPSKYNSALYNSVAHEYINTHKVATDGSVYLCGYMVGGGIQTNGIFHTNDAWLCKLDSCGYTVGASPQSLLTIDSVVNQEVFISNLSTEYCKGDLLVFMLTPQSNDTILLDSTYLYAYSQWSNGIDPSQVSYTLPDTGTYIFTLTTYAGDGIDTFTTSIEIKDTATYISATKPTLDFNIYPNPSKEYIVIDLGAAHKEAFEGEIYSIEGSCIARFSIPLNCIQKKITLPNVSKGVYYLKLSSSSGLFYNQKISILP